MNEDGYTPKGYACTKFCGVFTPKKKDPKVYYPIGPEHDLVCILCGNSSASVDSLRKHFKRCAEQHGNPRGHFFDDHPSVPPKEGGLQAA